MAIETTDITNFLAANPGMTDAQIAAAMDQYGVSAAQMAEATGVPLADVQSRYEAATAPAPAPAPAPESQPIVNFLQANQGMSDAQIAAAMDQYGITPAQMAEATGVSLSDVQTRYDAAKAGGLPTTTTQTETTTGGLPTTTETGTTTGGLPTAGANTLSGVILAGDSWIANNNQIAGALQNVTNQPITNTAVGGSFSSDVLNQLNNFLSSGGTFAPGSTVVLNIGGNDFLGGIDRNVTRNNIEQVVSTLDGLGVKVVLSGAPNVSTLSDISSNRQLSIDPLYEEIANKYNNVSLVDSMSGILSNPDLRTEDLIHTTGEGQTQFSNAIADAVRGTRSASITEANIENFINQNLNNPQAIADAASRFDVSASDIENATGFTPEQQAKYFALAGIDARYAGLPTLDPSEIITDRSGRRYETDALLNLANQIVPNLGELRGGIYSTHGESIGFGFDEATRILGREPSPGEQVILDMARNLMNQGVTDLSQLQVRDVYEDVAIRPVYDENGQPTGRYTVSYRTSPGDENQVTREITPEEYGRRTTRTFDYGEGPYSQDVVNIATQKGLYAADRLLTQGALDTLNYSIGNTYSGPGMTGYNITINPLTGQPQFTTFGQDTGQKALISSALTFASFIPGVAPFAQAASALWSIEQGNYLGAAATLASMGAGFSAPGSDQASILSNVSTGFRAVDAIQRNDPLALAASFMSNRSIAGDIGGMRLGDTNITLSDAGNAAALIAAVQSGNMSAMMNAAMALSRSSNSRTSNYGQRAMDGINSGDMSFAQDFSSEMADVIAASENLLTQDGLRQVTQTALNSQVSNSGHDNVNTAVYNAAIQSGMSEDQASGAADSVASVIQYPGGGVDTRGTENVQLAAADTGTRTDVPIRDVSATGTRYTVGQTIGDPSLRMQINENWQVVDADTGEPILQDNGEPYTISPAYRATAGEAETPGETTRVETFGVGPVEIESIQRSSSNLWDKIKDIGSLFSSGTSDPTAEKFALFGSGASGGDPTETFALFARDYPRDAIVFIENRVQEALSDPNVSDERRAEIVDAAEKAKSDIEKTIPRETPTSTVSGGGGGGGGITPSALQSMVEAGTAVQNPDQTVTVTHDDGSTQTFAPTGEQIAYTPAQEPADITYQTPTEQPIGPVASSGTTDTMGATGTTGITGTTGTTGTTEPASTTGTTGVTTEPGTTAEPGTGGGTGGGDGTGAGTGTGEGSGTGTGTGEGGGTGAGYGTGTGAGTTTTPSVPSTPSVPTTPTPARTAAPLLAMLDEFKVPKPRVITEPEDIKLFRAVADGQIPAYALPPQTVKAIEGEVFDFLDEKERKREAEKAKEALNEPYYDVEYAKEGGLIDHRPEFYSEGGTSVLANRYVRGRGDGTSDSVPAMLASGEFVIPADVVSSLGNGDNNAGAKTLDKFMEVIRVHKRSAPPNQLPEDSKGPLAYLQEALAKSKGKKHARTK